jgi:hypothetical protein
LSLTLTNAATGAPRRSGPKLGNAWANLPSSMAAMATSSADVTPPCPPRPWSLISFIINLPIQYFYVSSDYWGRLEKPDFLVQRKEQPNEKTQRISQIQLFSFCQ